MNLRTIAIVGAGHAGGRMAISLREQGFEGRIVLIGDEAELPYERPPLSKEMITGEAPFDSSALGDEEYWKSHDINLELGSAVVEVTPNQNRVVLENGREIGYEHVVFATGASVRRLAVFGEPDLPITYLRTIQDARWIHRHLRPGVGVIIVGAGVIGLEIASSVLKVGGTATVIEAGPTVMGRNVTPWVAQRLLEFHRAHGVAFHFNVQVDSVSSLSRGLRVKLDSGVELESDFAVVGVGVQPNDQLASMAGAEVDDGIVVDAQGRSSIENMWAVGDVARFPMMGQLVRQETWRHADSHPRTVAAALLGGDDVYDDVPGFWTEQLGRRFQLEGQIHGEEIIRDGIDNDGGFATLYVEDGKLLGASAVDNPKITALARRVIASGQDVDSNALRDPNIDLKRALRLSNLK